MNKLDLASKAMNMGTNQKKIEDMHISAGNSLILPLGGFWLVAPGMLPVAWVAETALRRLLTTSSHLHKLAPRPCHRA